MIAALLFLRRFSEAKEEPVVIGLQLILPIIMGLLMGRFAMDSVTVTKRIYFIGHVSLGVVLR